MLQELLRYEKAYQIKSDDILVPEGIYFPRRVLAKETEAGVIQTRPKSGVRRGGGKQGFQKPRSWADVEKAREAGYIYADPITEMGMRIRAGLQAVMDKWYNDTASAMVEGIHKADRHLPIEIRLARAEAVKNVKGMEDGIKALLRFSRGEKLPSQTIKKMERYFPLGAEAVRRKADRTAVTAVVKTGREDLQALQRTARQADKALSKARQLRATPPIGETIIIGGRLAGQELPVEIGQRVRQFFEPRPPGGLEGGVRTINNLVRPIVANLDLSAMFIQGSYGLASNPKAWATAAVEALKTMTDPKAMGEYFQKNRQFLEWALPRGLHWNQLHFPAEFGMQLSLQKLGVGPFKPFEASNLHFSSFGNILRTEQAKAVTQNGHRTLRVKEATELMEKVNHLTGYSKGRVLSLADIALFAPRFFKAEASVLVDAATKPGPAGDLARRSVAGLMAGWVALTYTINNLRGYETNFNPSKPNFLAIRNVAGHDIAPPTLLPQVLKAVAYSVDKGPLEGVKFLTTTKASIVARLLYDQMAAYNFRGEPVGGFEPQNWDSLEETVRNIGNMFAGLAPISIQTGREELQYAQEQAKTPLESLASVATGVGLGAIGARVSQFTFGDLRNEMVARLYGGKAWDDLNIPERMEVKRHPEYQALEERFGREYPVSEEERIFNDMEQAKSQRDASLERMAQEAERLNDKSAYREARGQVIGDYHTQYDLLSKQLEGTGFKFEERTKPEDLALEGYWQIQPESFANSFGEPDFDAWRKTRENYLATLGPEMADFVRQHEKDWMLSLPPTAQRMEHQLLEDRKLLEPYF